MTSENRSPSKVSLEDLLRLKRAERPPAEFWTQFEREFRTRQLAAAVEKKRWWFALLPAFRRVSRYQLPLGATAVLAITFLTVREYRDWAASVETPVAPFVSEAPSSSATLAATARDVEPAAGDAREVPAPIDLPAPTLVSAPVYQEDPKPSGAALAVSEQVERALSPSARSIAANLAAAVEGDPELSRVLTPAPVVPRVQTMREPLADVPTPSAARRARLLASYAPADEPVENERSAQVRERLASRLSEEQLYETVRRLSGSGDRLIVKF